MLAEQKYKNYKNLQKQILLIEQDQASDVYRDAGNRGALGPGGGFSTSGREGAFSSKSGRGRQDF
jgi:hypothetical protein